MYTIKPGRRDSSKLREIWLYRMIVESSGDCLLTPDIFDSVNEAILDMHRVSASDSDNVLVNPFNRVRALRFFVALSMEMECEILEMCSFR